MIKNNLNNSTAATNVAPKPFSISFCNIRGLSSNINPVHHHLQSINPYALFLTETKIKPLDPSNSTVLSPHLKCPGYELFSYFFPNGGVCAFIRSDVQTLHLKQFDLSNPGFQLFWLKISLPHATKYICTLYRSPNSNNHELLFDHLSKSIETITLQSPRFEIIVLGDFNIHNSNWLSYSSNVTNPAGREAEAFAIVNDLTQVISEPTRVPDRAGDKANTLDLFFTSNPSIYSPPTVSSPLGNSDHCLITLRHDFLPHLDRPLLRKESSTTARLTGTPFALFALLTLGLQAFQMILPLLLLSSPTQYFLAWIFLFLLLLARDRRFFSSSHLLSIHKTQICPSLEYYSHVWGGAPKSTLCLLDKVQSKAIRLIKNPNLAKSLQPLSHRRLVGDLSIYYRYFNGHCSQEIFIDQRAKG